MGCCEPKPTNRKDFNKYKTLDEIKASFQEELLRVNEICKLISNGIDDNILKDYAQTTLDLEAVDERNLISYYNNLKTNLLSIKLYLDDNNIRKNKSLDTPMGLGGGKSDKDLNINTKILCLLLNQILSTEESQDNEELNRISSNTYYSLIYKDIKLT